MKIIKQLDKLPTDTVMDNEIQLAYMKRREDLKVKMFEKLLEIPIIDVADVVGE